MTLTDRILIISERLETYSKADDIRQNRVKQNKLKDRLDISIDKLENIYKWLNAFRNCILNSESTRSSFNPGKFELIIDDLTSAAAHLSDCYRNEIKESDIKNIDKEIASVSKAILEYWKKGTDTINKNLIPMLNLVSVTGTGFVSQMIQNLRIDPRITTLPSIEEVDRYIRSVEKSREYIRSMDLNRDIRSLLSKISESRATLSDLNQNNLQWIKDHNLENKIKISF